MTTLTAEDKAAFAQDIRLLRSGDEMIQHVSSGLSSIETVLNSVITTAKNQLSLERFEHRESIRIQREVAAEGGVAPDYSDVVPMFTALTARLQSFIDSIGGGKGPSLVPTLLGGAAAAVGAAAAFDVLTPDAPPSEGPKAPDPVERPQPKETDQTRRVDPSPRVQPGGVEKRQPSQRTPPPAPPRMERPAPNRFGTPAADIKKPVTRVPQRPAATQQPKRTKATPSAGIDWKKVISDALQATPFGLAGAIGAGVASKVEEGIESFTDPGGASSAAGKYAPVLNAIASGEGDYNSMNRGVAGDSPGGSKRYIGSDLTDLTIGQVMALQASGRLMAAGRYQIIPSTMKNAVKEAGLGPKEKFSPANQDRLAIALIKEREALDAYINGRSNDLEAAMMDLAKEWASFPRPDTGGSYYSGVAGNKAQFSVAQTRAMLKVARGAAAASTTFTEVRRPRTLAEVVASAGDIMRSAATGIVARPVQGSISSRYGMRRHPIHGTTKMHKGVDFAAPMGSTVYAAKDGTVTLSGRGGGYGNLIEISHGGGLSTRYAHLSAMKVSVGQRVSAGQVIGNVGSTGQSTGPHLHFEVLKDGKQLNPEPFIKGTKRMVADTELAASATEPGVTPVVTPKTPGSAVQSSSQDVRVRKIKRKRRVVVVPPSNQGTTTVVATSTSSKGGNRKRLASRPADRYKAHFA